MDDNQKDDSVVGQSTAQPVVGEPVQEAVPSQEPVSQQQDPVSVPQFSPEPAATIPPDQPAIQVVEPSEMPVQPPVTSDPVQPVVEGPQTTQTKDKVTVLLIEDDPLLTKMYRAKFDTEGFNVLVAGDGKEGLEMALNSNPDFILLDIMMPKLSGLDLLTKYREDNRGKEVPVIVLTNLTQQKEAQRAMDLGAKEYLVKANLTPSQVVERIKKYIN